MNTNTPRRYVVAHRPPTPLELLRSLSGIPARHERFMPIASNPMRRVLWSVDFSAAKRAEMRMLEFIFAHGYLQNIQALRVTASKARISACSRSRINIDIAFAPEGNVRRFTSVIGAIQEIVRINQ